MVSKIKQALIKFLYFCQALFNKNFHDCPYCLSKRKYKIVYKKYSLIDINKCNVCSLLWTNPIFKFPKLYDLLYIGQGLTSDFAKAQKIISNKKFYDKDFTHIFQLIGELHPKATSILEYGCSWGYFLYQAKIRGYKTTGIEISEKRASVGKEVLGVDIVNSLDCILDNRKNFYDVVITLHTLEHLTSLNNIFNKFYSLLNSDGMLIIEVPKINTHNRRNDFLSMGAIHPLGFSEEFFMKNLPNHGFRCSVYNSYSEILQQYFDQGDNIIVICQKI